jgi:hypothetical protein
MVVLDEWQVVLSVPTDLGDDEAEALAAAVGARLRAWLAVETDRLVAIHAGCTVRCAES